MMCIQSWRRIISSMLTVNPWWFFTTRPRATIVDRYTGEVVSGMNMQAVPGGPAVADEDAMYFGSN